MSQIFTPIKNLFRFHKLKILGVLAFALLFTILIFPYDDLADVATTKISQMTNNNVYLQFDTLELGFFPPGVSMDNVAIETPTLPSIKASHLAVSPWLAGMLLGKQGAAVDAQSLFGGAVAADYRDGEKVKSGERAKNIAVDAKGLKLPALSTFLRDSGLLTLLLQGTADLSTQLMIDPSFETQPNGEVGLKVDNLTLPSQTLQVTMAPGSPPMPLPVPELKLGVTKLNAKMQDGSLQIADLAFGNDSTLSGRVSGQMAVSFHKTNIGVQPTVGTYDLKVNLKLPKEFVAANEKAGLSLAFAMLPPAARKDTAKGTELAFRIQPPGPGQGVPQITSLQ